MIIGKLSAPDLYGCYSDGIQKGFDFLRTLSENIPVGSYIIDDNMYVNVMECQTEDKEPCYENHKKYLDIHFVLKGGESIKWHPLDNQMNIYIPYEEDQDAAFYKANDEETASVALEGDKYIIMFPSDGHSCLHSLGKENGVIKKVVIKIRL